MIDDYEAAIKTLYDGERRAITDAIDNDTFAGRAENVLAYLSHKYEKLFDFASIEWSKRIVNDAAALSKAQLAYSILKLVDEVTVNPLQFKQGMLKEAIEAITTTSASLFKTIASEHHAKVQHAVMQSIVEGKGYKDLKPFFETFSNGTNNYAGLRTMDQSRKAYNGIAKARMLDAGFKKFQWVHTRSSLHPRLLHEKLSGKVFNFDDPPFIGVMYGNDIYGFPGDLPNCRCLMKPVIMEVN